MPSSSQHRSPSHKWRKHLNRAAILFMLMTMASQACNADQLAEAGKNKLAEITALVRHNENCPDVPRSWAAAFAILLMITPPTEEQVEAQEKQVLALRRRIGQAKWCQLYAAEMEQAYLAYTLAAGRR